MTPNELKKLEDSLWEAADNLRANSKLNAAEYSMPVLGLIFLRHATNRYERVKEECKAEKLPTRGGAPRQLNSDDYAKRGAIMLPEEAQYHYVAELSEGSRIGEALNHAMQLIEEVVPTLKGALPKSYEKFDNALLKSLVNTFNIDALKGTNDDVFGRIYEYFLNNFAMSGAQEGGEFFTPPALVRIIVNFIEPNKGNILDPACGSGGMFVQAAHFIRHAIDHSPHDVSPAELVTFYGQEKSESNTHIALMNLAVHGLGGDNIHTGNTFYETLPNLIQRCDFVMANPPFNVDMVDPKRCQNDPRLFTKTKIPGISKKTNSVSNANYLWIQYFYSYLNPTGRAGFVMAQSATDGGHGEKKLREEIVQTGDVDIMMSIGSNFFYTVTLPCSLWFFDRGRDASRKNKTLMLDARNIYRQVSRKVRDFSEEQLKNLTAIVWLYRGGEEYYKKFLRLVRNYMSDIVGGGTTCAHDQLLFKIDETINAQTKQLEEIVKAIPKGEDAISFKECIADRLEAIKVYRKSRENYVTLYDKWRLEWKILPDEHARQVSCVRVFQPVAESLKTLRRSLNDIQKLTSRAFDLAARDLGATRWDTWSSRDITKGRESFDSARESILEIIKGILSPYTQVLWLHHRFPDGVYADVPGLCKVVTTDEIAEQDYSLTPGRYVGIAPPPEEDEDAVEERLREIHAELAVLNEEAVELASVISANFEEVLGE